MQNQSITTCKSCGQRLIKKATKRKASQLTKPYYYTAYYFCSSCQKIYHSDEFKVVNKNLRLFTGQELDAKQADVEIWTDGACVHNGTQKAKAAWAFVSDDHEANGLLEGKQTNNRAEAYAIYYALAWAAKQRKKKIHIHTDSQITIHGVSKPAALVKENRDIFQLIEKLIQKEGLSVQYIKVLGHSGDIKNERVDKLANTLAMRNSQR